MQICKLKPGIGWVFKGENVDQFVETYSKVLAVLQHRPFTRFCAAVVLPVPSVSAARPCRSLTRNNDAAGQMLAGQLAADLQGFCDRCDARTGPPRIVMCAHALHKASDSSMAAICWLGRRVESEVALASRPTPDDAAAAASTAGESLACISVGSFPPPAISDAV